MHARTREKREARIDPRSQGRVIVASAAAVAVATGVACSAVRTRKRDAHKIK